MARVVARHEAGDDFFAVIVDWKMPGMDGVETSLKTVISLDLNRGFAMKVSTPASLASFSISVQS